MKLDELKKIKEDGLSQANSASSSEDIEKIRLSYLSKKGLIPKVMSEIRNVPIEEKAEFGQTINSFKIELNEIIKIKQKKTTSINNNNSFDLTLPGQWKKLGTGHPITQVTERINSIFKQIGFSIAEGPDIESVYNNFDALNTPADHPSRDEQDTFYLNNKDLLRCHTSPVQVRYMKDNKPPIRIISPGRCYRRDTPDATHSASFHQIEGLYVDNNVSLADLKGTISYFAKELMGATVKTRFRPHYFPFTEPSFEVDFMHPTNGWIEILGAGLVDPNVFSNVGYDSNNISGFAFGMGVERIAMILYGIKDIRNLYENDSRFLNQF